MEKHYDFTTIEPKMQEFWETEQIYRFDREAPGKVYSIDTPPPTVSGSLHIGHLFSYTQAEMIARFHRMQGENVFYPFGFDDNGLPSERLVERDLKIRANTMPRSEFIRACEGITQKYEDEFMDLWKSLGFSVDWTLQYKTISADVRKISQKLFLELVKSGKAYSKESPVLWCTECGTSIAQAELDTTDVESTFNYIPFMVEGTALEVATTRPELLYGCVCLFVNPEDPRYEKYIGKNAIVPLYNYEIPIYTDQKVDIEKGSGVVMCATFGDSTDAEWFTEHSLPYRRVILPNGTIDSGVPFIGGMKIIDARKEIIEQLKQNGLLLKSETITHTIGIHERCGKATEIIPSRQWYIDVLSEKERFLKAADEIHWYPEHMKNRYIAWVENLKWDWCISRQRYFGVPFPVWYCKSCGKAHFAAEELLPVNPLETAYIGKCECGCTDFIPESAVFDTWATSSISPQINERFGLPLVPMGMRTQAHEIIRTWTFYTIVRSLYHTGKLPWKDIMICGYVLAKSGEKISKSKGNSKFDPQTLIRTNSADALRYWSANAKLGTDTFFDETDLQGSKRFLTKLYNASKFAISHLQDIQDIDDLLNCQSNVYNINSKEKNIETGHSNTQNECDYSESSLQNDNAIYNKTITLENSRNRILPVDRWMMERTRETIQKASALLSEYEIGSARHEIDDLFWKDFCDYYIEIVKERLYRPDIHGEEERRSGQIALYYSLLNILKLYSIFVPHITEFIYTEFFRQYENCKSIHLLKWEKIDSVDGEYLAFGEKLKGIVADMRKYKSEHNLSMRTELEVLEIESGKFTDWFRSSEKDLCACSNAKEIKYL